MAEQYVPDDVRDFILKHIVSVAPKGRPRKQKRTLDDIDHDDEFIAATEEEFSVNVAGKLRKTPAMDLIYTQLVRKAVAGDARCMLKVIELREKHSEKHKEDMRKLYREYLETKKGMLRNPEDFTDEFEELIESFEPLFKRNRMC